MNTEIHLKRVSYLLILSTTLISSLQILLQLLSSIYWPLLKCWHSTQCLFSKSHRLKYDASTVWHVKLVADWCKRTNSTSETKSGLVRRVVWFFSSFHAYGPRGSNLLLLWNVGMLWWENDAPQPATPPKTSLLHHACICFSFFFLIKKRTYFLIVQESVQVGHFSQVAP